MNSTVTAFQHYLFGQIFYFHNWEHELDDTSICINIHVYYNTLLTVYCKREAT